MNNPTCAQCDCVAGCQAGTKVCPNATEPIQPAEPDDLMIAYMAGLADGKKAAQAVQTAKPVAWQWLDTGTFRKTLPKTAVVADWNPLFKNSAAIAQPEQNFCARCGKRLAKDSIHTCTPPKSTL